MRIRSPLMVLVLLTAAVPLAAQSLDWSTVASAGVSGSSNGATVVTGPALSIPTNAVYTAEFRYPVTNTYGSATSKQPGWTTFSMTYADNGAGGSVTADVMEVDSCSTTERSLCSLTSADGTGATTCDTCTLSSALDFSNHSYYVHVTITKTDLPADPKLYSLALY